MRELAGTEAVGTDLVDGTLSPIDFVVKSFVN